MRSWEKMDKPKSMLKKLEEDYAISQRTDNGRTKNMGHRIGFYNELEENLPDFYDFGEGRFTLYKKHESFIWWDYN